MGQENSRMLFVQVLKTMLRSRGAKVSTTQLQAFLQFVGEVCPWFPEEGTVSVETWAKVGEKIQGYYQAHGPQKVPVEAFSLWALVRDCLDPRHEDLKVKEKLAAQGAPPAPVVPTAPPAPPLDAAVGEELDPKDAQDLEEAAAQYERDKGLILLAEDLGAKEDPVQKVIGQLAIQLQEALQTVTRQAQGKPPARALTPAPPQVAEQRGSPELEEGAKRNDAQREKEARMGSKSRSHRPKKGRRNRGLSSESSGMESMEESTEAESSTEDERPGFTQRVRVLKGEEKLMVAMAQAGPRQKNDPGWGKVQARPSKLSPLQAALREARAAGEDMEGFEQDGFVAYPVYEHPAQGNNPPQRVYGVMDFKKLKELKVACAQYGPTAPYTEVILEAINDDYTMCPNDWKQLARACLSGGDYLLWKTEYTENCEKTHRRNVANQVQSNLEAMLGEGQYADTQQQLDYNMAYYAQISLAARKAWKKLPTSKNVTMDLTKIRQGPDELYQDFVSRLLDAAGKLLGDGDAGLMIAKQLAFENANVPCQAALRPYRHKGSLNDYVRICQDIGPSYTTGITLAAALRGQTVQQFLQPSQGRGRGKRVPGPPGSCFSCGQVGHFSKDCPQRAPSQSVQGGSSAAPGTCPRCKKGRHWAKDCRSKLDLQGNLLPAQQQQGNWKGGRPQAPQTYGAFQGALQGLPLSAGNPFVTSSEPPQEAQDWTSVPPPTQY